MKLFPLALTAGVLPLFTIHLCYFLAVYYHHLPACIPYFDSCTSISAAGRSSPEYFIFKGLMIPATLAIALYWVAVRRWLQTILHSRALLTRTIVGFAIGACLGFLLYTLVLGAIGDVFRAQRRIGVITFFLFTFIAQLLFAINATRAVHSDPRLRIHARLSWGVVLSVLALGLFALAYSTYDEARYDQIEDALEWWVTLILCMQPVVVASMWRTTNFRLQFSVGKDN